MITELINLYSLVVLAAVILSWVRPAPEHPLVRAVYALTEPVLNPIRKLLPDLGGIDLSPMVLLFALRILGHVI